MRPGLQRTRAGARSQRAVPLECVGGLAQRAEEQPCRARHALAWQSVTGGGIGVVGAALPAPFNSAAGLFYLCLTVAAWCTWMTLNVAQRRFGRALKDLHQAA
jgi:hypothetical protein